MIEDPAQHAALVAKVPLLHVNAWSRCMDVALIGGAHKSIRCGLQPRHVFSQDQCIEQMKAGKVFVGLAEGPIRFLPTYKVSATVNGVVRQCMLCSS